MIIGGGDTGADCLGTVHRQGARSVHQFELLERPPDVRHEDNPWPQWPNVFRTSSAHEEGGERVYAVSTERFLGNDEGRVRALQAVSVEIRRDGTDAGHARPRHRVRARGGPGAAGHGLPRSRTGSLLSQLGVRLTERGNVWRDEAWMTTEPGVFTAGDMQRGQSLIVWAIADGRNAARSVDGFLAAKRPDRRRRFTRWTTTNVWCQKISTKMS